MYDKEIAERDEKVGGFRCLTLSVAEPHSSVGSIQDLRAVGRWFDHRLGLSLFFPRIDDSHCVRIHSFLTAVQCFDSGYVGKQPVAWKEYCAEYWLKQLQDSMDGCPGRSDITETLLKTALNNIKTTYSQSINQLSLFSMINTSYGDKICTPWLTQRIRIL